MIEYLNGTLAALSATQAVVECCGVGYGLEISLTTQNALREQPLDSAVKLLVHEVIREDEHQLYGFAEDRERQLFRLLIGVSGVGPNTARIMLSTLSVGELAQAIANDDVKRIQHVKGIGTKTAQRVIVELKDKMKTFGTAHNAAAAANTEAKEEALQALTILGFPKAAAEKVLAKLDNKLTTEELIKAAMAAL